MFVTKKIAQKMQDGSSLEIVLQPYADRILVLITQLGKVGSLVLQLLLSYV
jgi:hypothetical protein